MQNSLFQRLSALEEAAANPPEPARIFQPQTFQDLKTWKVLKTTNNVQKTNPSATFSTLHLPRSYGENGYRSI